MSINLTVSKHHPLACLQVCESRSNQAQMGEFCVDSETEVKMSARFSPEAAEEVFTSRQPGWLRCYM